MKKTFLEQFRYNVAQYGADTAAVDSAQRLSYAQLDRLSGQIAAFLKRQGIGREDIVALDLPRCVEYIAAELAVIRAGAAFVPLDPGLPGARRAYILEDSGCRLILDREACAAALQEEPVGWAESSPHDLAYIIYTSGSTGKPKGVMQEYGSLDLMAWTNDELQGPFCNGPEGHRPVSAALLSPMMYIATVFTTFLTLYEGNAIHLVSEDTVRDKRALLDYFRREKIGHTFITASLYRQFPFEEGLSLRTVFTGGEAVSGLAPHGFALFNCYAMSEFGCAPFGYRIEAPQEHTPAGRPSALVDVRLLSADGDASAREGLLCIRLPYFRGYRNLPEMTERAFLTIDGERYFNTNDIAKVDGEGLYRLYGRADNVVKINGNRVEPEEVERTLRGLFPQLREVVVRSFRNRRGGQYLCAFYQADEEIRSRSFWQSLAGEIASYMIPQVFVRVADFPRNVNGKIDRKALVPPLKANSSEYAAPRNALEEELCRGFEVALELERVGIHDDFYELGGDSLATMALVMELKIPGITFRQILDGRTPEKIAEACARLGLEVSRGGPSAAPQGTRDDYPLRPIQRWICALQQRHPNSTAWNLPGLMRLDDEIDFDRLVAAVRTVLQRHDVYGTRYFRDPDSGALRQRFVPEREELRIEDVTQEEFERIRSGLVQNFPLIEQPLYRSRAFRAPSGNYFFMDAHHSIADGTSIRIFFREIDQVYRGEELPASVQYADVIERELLWQSRRGACDEDGYWMDILKHYDEQRYRIPIDRNTSLDEKGELLIPLREIRDSWFEGKHFSENVFFLSAAALSLARFLGLREIALAWVYNGRDSAEKMDAIGLLIHELPIYYNFDLELSLEELLTQTRESILNALAHLDSVSKVYDTLTDRVNCFLFQQNIHDDPMVDGREMPFVPVADEEATASNILDMELLKIDRGYQLYLDYDRGLYRQSTIVRLSRYFEQTVAYMWRNPGSSVSEILNLANPR
ncbi:MAG: AMP-binding protein [Oscillospiraceae bacterium]|nr:AMP-binding protein [Oscillospiraceae bacterium]